MAFSTILVANRGEIAVRVMRTAAALGYETVAVYSDPDRGSPHVTAASRSVALGGTSSAESYLRIDKIIAAARASGAEAIHPGYGFLSENPDFAAACEKEGLIFIGPPSTAIRLMGNKALAKQKMIEAGVPCVPGYQGARQDDATFIEQADRIGFPVMVKAAAGGGGRGMRLVTGRDDLPTALGFARSEAAKAFGSDELLLEKAVIRPRHVEIQIFADQHGGALYLGERDCSVQRRHQKIIEESPCPVLDAGLRRQMGEAAVLAAKSASYVGAGTVEFLLDESRNFYFLEMNTRLQVEHPVTEMVTGFDLVQWQLEVAQGKKLRVAQDDVRLSGHAIEIRLYAEDPANGFLPQTGKVLRWKPPAGHSVRTDHALREGQVISPHYDPLLAKVIVHGRDRLEAVRRLAGALRNTEILGVVTNKKLLEEICADPVFASGGATTAFIAEQMASAPSLRPFVPETKDWVVAAMAVYLGAAKPGAIPGWRSAGPIPSVIRLGCGDTAAGVRISRTGGRKPSGPYAVSLIRQSAGKEPAGIHAVGEVEAVLAAPGLIRVTSGSRDETVHFVAEGDQIYIDQAGRSVAFRNLTNLPAAGLKKTGTGVLMTPMDGIVAKVFVKTGDRVERGQPLLAVEAMKMEHPIRADTDGIVEWLGPAQGTQVKARQIMARVTPDDGTAATSRTGE